MNTKTAFLPALLGAALAARADLGDYALPIVGTDNTMELSTGNLYPCIARPWGAHAWTPQTGDNETGWIYSYGDRKIRGIRLTHQPSPWIGDYGQFSLMPTKGLDKFDHAFPDEMNEYLTPKIKAQVFPMLCNHCTNPPCVRVCPTQATYKLPNGIVTMDYHRCIGCRFCMAGCPYGARSFNFVDPRKYLPEQVPNPKFPTRMIGVVEKCTFCVERLDKGMLPACVEASGGRILFGDLEDPNSVVRKALAENFTIRRKPSLGTQPGVYYII